MPTQKRSAIGACMAILYNINPKQPLFFKNLSKVVIGVGVMALSFGAISCRKAATATSDRAAIRPTSEAIAEADSLYGQRADLVKVRQAIVALRQAQAGDPANFDLAWRLSKFNYYLGAHTPESREQDKAYREGIDAGKLAVQLQDGKPEGHFW